MIKVIKYGTRAIGECENCGCRFSYEEENIKETNKKTYIECPQCSKAHTLTATR